MFTNTKRTFLPVLFLLALTIVLIACTPMEPGQSGLDSPATANEGTITVVGKGEAFGQPDKAQAQVGAEVFAPTVEEATNQNAVMIQQIIDALKAQGIADEDIQTTNYSLWAEQIYGDRGPEGIAGYRVTNQVNIIIRDISKVGDILAAATDAGANSIYGVSFSVADPSALEAEAREKAMADARERAASLAQLGEVQLSTIKTISEIVEQPVYPLMGRGGGASEVASLAPGISPGQLSYQVQVQVTFNIE